MEVWAMGLSMEERKRLQELVSEAKKIGGGCLHPDGRPKTFTELEDECIEIGDLFTAELLLERVTEQEADAPSPCCPSCGRVGKRSADEPRLIETDRGEVGWKEPAYYCNCCRQSFFPSLR
jgi:hypothetical protein